MMEVIVIGGGVVGLAVADELTQRGISVKLLETNPRVGQEASTAAAGILPAHTNEEGPGPFQELIRLGYNTFSGAARRLARLTGIDLRLKKSGMLSVAFRASDEEALAREEGWHREAGIPHQRLTASEVRKLEPRVSPAARSGLFYPEVFQVDVARLVEAYRRVVKAQGAEVLVGTPAARFLLKADQVVGVETPRGALFADGVVNCAGPWAGFDPGLAFTIPSVPVRGQMIQFQAGPSFISHILAGPRAYLVQRAAGVLIAGTTVEYAGFDKRVTEEGLAAIRAGALEIAPSAGRLPVEKSWAGLRPGTPDGRPILGPAPLKGLFLASGHCRNGVLLAPWTGRAAADWLTRAREHPELASFGVDRFLAKPDGVVAPPPALSAEGGSAPFGAGHTTPEVGVAKSGGGVVS